MSARDRAWKARARAEGRLLGDNVPALEDGRVFCMCWCERQMLQVPAEWVVELRTGSCGAPGCGP